MTETHFRNIDDCIKRIKSIKEMYADGVPSEVALSDAINALEEIQQYRAIGTPEECRAAVEKQKEVKNKAIDDFVEKAMKQFTDFDLKHGYPTVIDCKVILRDIAEQMKGSVANE